MKSKPGICNQLSWRYQRAGKKAVGAFWTSMPRRPGIWPAFATILFGMRELFEWWYGKLPVSGSA
jgi:hypothetical protein